MHSIANGQSNNDDNNNNNNNTDIDDEKEKQKRIQNTYRLMQPLLGSIKKMLRRNFRTKHNACNAFDRSRIRRYVPLSLFRTRLVMFHNFLFRVTSRVAICNRFLRNCNLSFDIWYSNPLRRCSSSVSPWSRFPFISRYLYLYFRCVTWIGTIQTTYGRSS